MVSKFGISKEAPPLLEFLESMSNTIIFIAVPRVPPGRAASRRRGRKGQRGREDQVRKKRGREGQVRKMDTIRALDGSHTCTQWLSLCPLFGPDPSSKEWEEISKSYAQQACGLVRGVIGQDLRPGNIWETREKGALTANRSVTQIDTIDPKTGATKIFFKR